MWVGADMAVWICSVKGAGVSGKCDAADGVHWTYGRIALHILPTKHFWCGFSREQLVMNVR